jgi:two-component system response regulator TctD
LLLTGYGEANDIVIGFETGCDDYLPKPYTFAVLLARLRRLLQSMEQVPEVIEKGPFTLRLASMIALLHGRDILLTQKEFALLLLFVQNEGTTMSAEYLYEKIWEKDTNNDVRAVKIQVSNLRAKIEGSGYAISAIRSVGYRFEQEQ